MNAVKRWFAQSGLVSKLFMGLALTSAVLVVHKMWLGPYVRRQRYKQAEAWAEMIIENEEKELNSE